jgi:hypothetical protein
LRGATITAFEKAGENYKLTYEVNGEKRAILYAANTDGTYPFEFQNGREGTTKEVYTRRPRGGDPGGGGGPREGIDPRETSRPPEGERAPARQASEASPQAKPSSATSAGLFVLSSPEVANGGALPMDYTGDGTGSTLPLQWSGAPAGTKSFALLMHHLDPEGVTKSYWILYNIPANVTSLPRNAKGIGTLGASFKGMVGYEPPHSKGPGPKTYVLTLYALSATLEIHAPPEHVTYDVVLAAMQGKILASTDLSVVYTRNTGAGGKGDSNQPPGRPPR